MPIRDDVSAPPAIRNGAGAPRGACPACVASLPLFDRLPPDIVGEISAAARISRAGRGQALFRQGATASRLYVVTSGLVKLVRTEPDGTRLALRVACAGGVVGGAAVLDGVEYPYSAEALTACELAWWDAGTWARLAGRHPAVAMAGLRSAALAALSAYDRVAEVVTKRSDQRLAAAVMEIARHALRAGPPDRPLVLDVSQQDLAEIACLNQATVSRVFAAWRQAGIASAIGHQVLLMNPAAITGIATGDPGAS
jgi:CRP-like cAMP-binding protein